MPAPSVPRPRRIVLALLLAFGPLLFGELLVRAYYGLFASEAANRNFSLFADEPGARFVPHPYLGYALTPDWTDVGKKTHHDASGFRGPAPEHRDDRILIAVLGGSTVYGAKIDDDQQTFPAALERSLQQEPGGRSVEMLNAGVPGYTSFESFANLAFRVLDQHPRVVLVYDAVNDLHARRARPQLGDNGAYRHAWREPQRPLLALARHSYLARWAGFRVGLRPLSIEEYTRSDPDMSEEPPVSLLAENPPTYFRRNLENIARLSRSRGAFVVLCTFAINPDVPDHYARFAYYREGIREMNDVIRDVAKAESALLIDVEAELSRDRGLWSDGVHVNERGAAAQAAIVAKALLASSSWQTR